MDRLYVFLIENRIGIYIVCAIGLFWFISTLVRARTLLRGSVFSIERENAIRLQNTALIVIFVLLALIGMVYYVNAAIRPTLPDDLLVPPTFTPDIFATPLASPTPLITAPSVGPTDTPFLVATATLPPGIAPVTGGSAQTRLPQSTRAENSTPGVPTATPSNNQTVPTPAAVTPSLTSPPAIAGCGPGVNISSPGNGATVSGVIAIQGTANVPDFFFYKLEIAGPETGGNWASLLSSVMQQPVQNSTLGTANLGSWTNGEYTLRLTVVDGTSNEVGSCLIGIRVENS